MPAAVNQLIRPTYEPNGPNAWYITETARAGGLYQVRRYPGDRCTCTCPDHRYRQRDCKHILWLKHHVFRDQQ